MAGGLKTKQKKEVPTAQHQATLVQEKANWLKKKKKQKKKELTKTVEDQEQRRKEDEKKSLDGEAEGSPVELFLCRSSVLGEGEPRRC